MSSWWSWLLFAIGVFGLWLYTAKPKIGPWFNIFSQVFWITYGFSTKQYGFIVSSIVYIILFSWMLVKAHRVKESKQQQDIMA